MSFKKFKIKDLIFSEYNPRKISDEKFTLLKQSIKDFGNVCGVVVNVCETRRNVIISGHQRLRACKELGIKVITAFAVDISDIETEKNLNLTLNRKFGDFDTDIMLETFSDFDFSQIKFDDIDLSFLDEKPKPAKPLTKNISPYKKQYFLISCDFDKTADVVPYIDKIRESGIESVEVNDASR